MKSETIGSPIQVRGKLALLGWPSVRAWARAHGYLEVTVRATVRTWGERTDRQPHGGFARAIVHDLRRTFRDQIGPSTAPDAAVSSAGGV